MSADEIVDAQVVDASDPEQLRHAASLADELAKLHGSDEFLAARNLFRSEAERVAREALVDRVADLLRVSVATVLGTIGVSTSAAATAVDYRLMAREALQAAGLLGEVRR